MSVLALSSGFNDPVLDGQATFHAAMNALARPGSIQALGADLDPPAPLTAELAAIALALTDHETTLWLDAWLAGSAAVVDYLRFHTGVRIVAEPAQAAFALVVDQGAMPPLSQFALGTDEYPDRSTTIVLAVETISPGFPVSAVLRDASLRDAPQDEGDFRALREEESLLSQRKTNVLHPEEAQRAVSKDARRQHSALVLTGPGIETVSQLIITPWPADLTAQLAANRALFPRGVDLIVTAPGVLAALPRTTTVSEG